MTNSQSSVGDWSGFDLVFGLGWYLLGYGCTSGVDGVVVERVYFGMAAFGEQLLVLWGLMWGIVIKFEFNITDRSEKEICHNWQRRGYAQRSLQLCSLICWCLKDISYTQILIISSSLFTSLLPLLSCLSLKFAHPINIEESKQCVIKHLAQLSQLTSLPIFASIQNMTTPQFEVHWTALIDTLMFVNLFVTVRFPTQSYSQRLPCTIGQVCWQPFMESKAHGTY